MKDTTIRSILNSIDITEKEMQDKILVNFQYGLLKTSDRLLINFLQTQSIKVPVKVIAEALKMPSRSVSQNIIRLNRLLGIVIIRQHTLIFLSHTWKTNLKVNLLSPVEDLLHHN